MHHSALSLLSPVGLRDCFLFKAFWIFMLSDLPDVRTFKMFHQIRALRSNHKGFKKDTFDILPFHHIALNQMKDHPA